MKSSFALIHHEPRSQITTIIIWYLLLSCTEILGQFGPLSASISIGFKTRDRDVFL